MNTAAWQVGSGYCTTLADALAHVRSCPQGNDPLEFIFGDLLARLSIRFQTWMLGAPNNHHAQ